MLAEGFPLGLALTSSRFQYRIFVTAEVTGPSNQPQIRVDDTDYSSADIGTWCLMSTGT